MARPKFWENLINVKATQIKVGGNTLDEATLGKIVGEGVPIIFIGTINASANPDYPAASKGHQWLFTHSGKIGGSSGEAVEAGDKLVCIEDSVTGDHATVGSKFAVVQGNVIDGVTSSEASTANAIARYSGVSGLIIKNTGVVIDDDDDITGIRNLGVTGTRITKGWFTDLEMTNHPVLPSGSPTLDNQATNKAYVDSLEYRDNTHRVIKAASGDLRHSHDAEATTQSDEYEVVKTITFTNGILGSIRAAFDLKTSDSVGPTLAYGRLYKNGIAIGTEQSDNTGSYVNKSEDLTEDFGPGDTLELWAKIADVAQTSYVENFRVSYTDAPTIAVASVNS